jgi:hypothetical protein
MKNLKKNFVVFFISRFYQMALDFYFTCNQRLFGPFFNIGCFPSFTSIGLCSFNILIVEKSVKMNRNKVNSYFRFRCV